MGFEVERPGSLEARLQREHHELRGRMRDVEELLYRMRAEGVRPGDRDLLLARLRGLRDELVRHFAREEEAGLVGPRSAVGEDAERARLHSQHEHFRKELAWLVGSVDAAGALSPQVLDESAARVALLFSEIRWHDAVEMGLLRRTSPR